MATELEKRTIFAADFGIAAPPASEAAMKGNQVKVLDRPAAVSPRHEESLENPKPLSPTNGGMGRHPGIGTSQKTCQNLPTF